MTADDFDTVRATLATMYLGHPDEEALAALDRIQAENEHLLGEIEARDKEIERLRETLQENRATLVALRNWIALFAIQPPGMLDSLNESLARIDAALGEQP